MFHHAMREEYLKPTPLKPYMTYADHLVWPIHVPRRCEPLITPHLSLWGNSRTRATFPTHKKSHNPHPQGEGGKGVNMGTLHCGGVGGVPAKPGSYIYIYIWWIESYVWKLSVSIKHVQTWGKFSARLEQHFRKLGFLSNEKNPTLWLFRVHSGLYT